MKQCPACEREFKDQLHFCPFDGLALVLQPDNDKLIGTILDNKYRIDEKIGEGGMGRVYRATHIHMGGRQPEATRSRISMREGRAEIVTRDVRESLQVRQRIEMAAGQSTDDFSFPL